MMKENQPLGNGKMTSIEVFSTALYLKTLEPRETVIDPIDLLVKWAILPYKPKGTKILFLSHKILFASPIKSAMATKRHKKLITHDDPCHLLDPVRFALFTYKGDPFAEVLFQQAYKSMKAYAHLYDASVEKFLELFTSHPQAPKSTSYSLSSTEELYRITRLLIKLEFASSEEERSPLLYQLTEK
jgi:hypothetical protein